MGWGWWLAVTVAGSAYLISARLSCPRLRAEGVLDPPVERTLTMGRMETATAGVWRHEPQAPGSSAGCPAGLDRAGAGYAMNRRWPEWQRGWL